MSPSRFRAIAGACALLTLLSGCATLTRLRGRNQALDDYLAKHPESRGASQPRFLYEDFGTLDDHALRTVAIPWKLAVTGMLLAEAPARGLPVELASLQPLLESCGFLYPDSIANWDTRQAPRPRLDGPLGITRGMARPRVPGFELEVANIGCASCHAAWLIGPDGEPTRTAWLGMPNPSINLRRYSDTVFRGLQRVLDDEPGALATMRRLFPGMSGSERRAVRSFVMPELRRRVPLLARATGTPVPFDNGGPGYSNGVAAFKFQTGTLDTAHSLAIERGFTSIPSLWSRPFRTSLLVDGVYARPGTERFRVVTAKEAIPERLDELAHIAAFVTVGTAGNTLADAERAIPRVQLALRFLAQETPPRFPGPIDTALAREGQDVFDRRCSKCHGRYDQDLQRPKLLQYPNRLVPDDANHTDPLRWQLASDIPVRERAPARWRPFFRQVEPAATRGYVAPLLTGLWATAPYLHNGSVPTLWHMLHPRARPDRFWVGGQRYDLARVGFSGDRETAIAPAGRRPSAEPALYDTSRPGLSNRGHVDQVEVLDEDEKRALLEYLKAL